MNKINSINGILITAQNDFTEHVENMTDHVTEEERTAWNAKADTEVIETHLSDHQVHVSEAEKDKWNNGIITPSPYGYPLLTDTGLTLGCRGYGLTLEANIDGGRIHASSTLDGNYTMDLKKTALHPDDETCHLTAAERTVWNAKADLSDLDSKMDTSTFNAHTNDAVAHVTEEERQRWNAAPEVDASGNMALTGILTTEGIINAHGGVHVPAPETASDAISYDAFLEHQARQNWERLWTLNYNAIPAWVSTVIRMQQLCTFGGNTPNASVQEGIIGNDLYDHVVKMTPKSGVSLLGRLTTPWRFASFLGDYEDPSFATAAVWCIDGADHASIMLGSTTHGYGFTSDMSASCYAHPIHWGNYQVSGADYRYPLYTRVAGATGVEAAPAWQATIYGKSYLGSSSSCLVRGTDFGQNDREIRYVWALVPSIWTLGVAMTPRNAETDHPYALNRWEMFVDGKYVMPMTTRFCGSGHTAALSVTVKEHEVASTRQVGLRMAGMRVDTNSKLGGTKAIEIMKRVAMDGVTPKPIPTVEASTLEVGAEGGDVVLTVSSALSEAVYVLNDTMCGHDDAAVWCRQSAEEIPEGEGQMTLTIAANTTGQARKVWLFAGHHYAQSAVMEINQLA